MFLLSQILPMAPTWRARMIIKPNQIAPGEGEEEEGGPVDRFAQPREASHLMEVDREVCEV